MNVTLKKCLIEHLEGMLSFAEHFVRLKFQNINNSQENSENQGDIHNSDLTFRNDLHVSNGKVSMSLIIK